MAEVGDERRGGTPKDPGLASAPPASDGDAETLDALTRPDGSRSPGEGVRPAHRTGGPNPVLSDRVVQERRRGVPRLLVISALFLALLAAIAFGYRYWQDQQLYVVTDNAQVTGALVQVGSLNAGRIDSIAVDIGDRVARDQVLATVVLPSSLGQTSSGVSRMGFADTDDARMVVRSPVDGVVVVRHGNVGDTVAAGQPIFTVVDPGSLWVQAQIEETKISRVHTGQAAEVTVDSLGRSLPGRVVAVGRATAATFSILPQTNASGNFNRVTQLVPVKIAVDYGQLPLVVGSSATVRILVQE